MRNKESFFFARDLYVVASAIVFGMLSRTIGVGFIQCKSLSELTL